MRSHGRIALLLLIAAAIAFALASGAADLLTLDTLRDSQAELARMLEAHPVAMVVGFFLLYVAITSLSIPGAAIMTLAAGAIFGLFLGAVIASFASATGATLAFLASRYLLRGWVERRYGRRVEALDRGIAKDGIFYLLTLRLNPAVPYFLVNLAMGLTKMRVPAFTFTSQAGMLPATLVYVNAGTQLARIREPSDILSPALVGSLVLLSLFPLLAKFAVDRLRRGRVYKGWRRPRRFDRNLIVIGAGAGGLVTAYIGATVRAKVTLIEGHRMGGDCLNTGCVPSKALIRSARLAHEIRTADRFGLEPGTPRVDLARVMARVREVIAHIEPADSPERYRKLGVDVRLGHARLIDPWTVEVNGERITGRAIVLATGAEPVVPPIPGLADVPFLTSDTMWDALSARGELPRRVAIVGGGPIGTEMAQAFARLGSAVSLVEAGPRILPREDEDAAAFVAGHLRGEGVEILTAHQAVRAAPGTLTLRGAEGDKELAFDELILAVGRRPRLSGYGLEDLGFDTAAPLELGPFLDTRFPNIFAVGDFAGPYQFTHAAAHQAWFAAVNALFGSVKRFRPDYRFLPWVTYTDPEVGRVGHNEASARATGLAYEVVRHELSHLDRAVTEGAAHGFVKILVAPGRDRILGATVVAHNAGELIATLTLAMKHGIGLNKILGTIHAYPTMAEANRYAAGEWKQAHKPERLLALAERWHRRRRG
ncbi:MAG: FAD-dependent oxidoreductase [Allosphingosinicella sp.]|uniref:FAD-dependent oxidoreductase n=1 Tax=Allosphingosinicella sp. TaxID=2823234 RepID=UPI003955F6B4